MSSDILFELGTEELPPKSLKTLSDSLSESVKSSLAASGLNFSSFEGFCSPRRLAFVIKGLDDETPKNELQVWGPPAKIAFDQDGKATKAAQAFCSRNGITADQIQVASDGKVDKIFCLKMDGGELCSSLLPKFIQTAIDQLPIAKRMRWGASRTEFVRPAQWLVLMQNNEVIDTTILGQTSGNVTRGHRFLCNQEVALSSPSSYESCLESDAKVIASFDKRKQLIVDQVTAEAKRIGGQAVISPDLLDEVTALVEWPVAVSGNFDSAFLSVPAEALISSMKEHQKYFHVVDENNALLPLFITVSNIETKDYSSIKSGNEKVIRPRLADAAFFFNTDKKQSLAQRRDKLKNVVFQAKLGSIFDKTERIKALAEFIAAKLDKSHTDITACAELCKSDLVSNMVSEFPDMQGIAGYHYAMNDGLNSDIAQGIVEHYQPKFAGDMLPESDTGAIVGLADRIDTLTGIFGIGQLPTGSKDPFALRRASVSVLRIIVEKEYNLNLAELIAFSLSQHSGLDNTEASQATTLAYVLERFKAVFDDKGISAEVWQSVAAKGLSQPLDIHQRALAIHAFYQDDAAKALASANKRVANILAKQKSDIALNVDASLFEQEEEHALFDALNSVKSTVKPLLDQRAYGDALQSLSTLRNVVDAYFDKVMVMSDDLKIRNNRLAVLTELRGLFLNIADIRFLALK